MGDSSHPSQRRQRSGNDSESHLPSWPEGQDWRCLYKPGETVPVSGQYPLLGPKGGDTGQEVTSVKGEPFPPTPKPGMGYGKPDKSK